jgi:hypothetical protein
VFQKNQTVIQSLLKIQTKMNQASFSLGPKTRIQIADEYSDMKPRQLTAKIKRFNLDIPSGDIMIKHQKMIYEAFGYPSSVKKEWYAHV